jgi:hypothetical protein
MSVKKMCPYCGSTRLCAAIMHPAIVELNDDGNLNVLEEMKDRIAGFEIGKCQDCKREVTEEQLVVGVKCSKCGEIVPANELDDDGICLVCAAEKNRPDLATMSQRELIKRLLELEKEKGMSSFEKKNSDIVKAAEPDNAQPEQTSVAVENNQPEEAKPTKKRAVKKKKEEQPAEEPQETAQTDIPTDQVPADMMDILGDMEAQQPDEPQNAPFPNVDPPMCDPLGDDPMPEVGANNALNADPGSLGSFAMYDDSADKF